MIDRKFLARLVFAPALIGTAQATPIDKLANAGSNMIWPAGNPSDPK